MIIELFLFLVIIVLFYKYFEKPKGIPPGEWGYPFIGKLPPTNLPARDYFQQLKSKYGNIFSIKMGGRLYVFLSDYSLIKTAFNKPELTGRPDIFTFRLFMYFQNLGIAGSDNKVWQDNRRFALHQLRDLGMGKSVLEDTIAHEVTALLQVMDKNVGEPYELSWSINVAIINVIWGLVASKRFSVDDPKMMEFAKLLSGDIDLIQGSMRFLDLFPHIEPFVPSIIKNKVMKVDVVEKGNDKLFSFFQEAIDEHEKELDQENPKDYIDAYLVQIKKEMEDKDSTFRPDYLDLKISISDLFFAGSETTSSSIRFTCMYLVLNPEVQEKIQQQIDEVVPKDTTPSLQHKDRLVYLEATLLEVQRKISLTPVGIPHAALTDTTLDNYNIPKGTLIMAFQEDCHNNSKYWEKPDEFYPEHFIDENGKLITKKDGFLPFSVGRRACIGESLAKMELFLFMSAILQKYKLSQVPGENLKVEFDRNSVFLNVIKPFNVVLTLRN